MQNQRNEETERLDRAHRPEESAGLLAIYLADVGSRPMIDHDCELSFSRQLHQCRDQLARLARKLPKPCRAYALEHDPGGPRHFDGTVYAIEGTCTHRGGPLGQGSLEGTTVTCPWHGATFDVRTGNHLTAPAPQGVSSYNVKIVGDDIHVEIPEP